MVEEDLNLSFFFGLMLMNPILLWSLWMVKIHNIGKRPRILSFSPYKIIRFEYLLPSTWLQTIELQMDLQDQI
jgi:hypothetical protein